MPTLSSLTSSLRLNSNLSHLSDPTRLEPTGLDCVSGCKRVIAADDDDYDDDCSSARASSDLAVRCVSHDRCDAFVHCEPTRAINGQVPSDVSDETDDETTNGRALHL